MRLTLPREALSGRSSLGSGIRIRVHSTSSSKRPYPAESNWDWMEPP
jgi:hypothetical protein